MFLIGEQLGRNLGNNGYAFWRQALKQTEAYFVIHKDMLTSEIIQNLSDYEKKYIVISDTKEHVEKYLAADLLFCTLSYRDVVPSHVDFNAINKGIIYLQHGTLGLKEVYYTERSYRGLIHEFIYFNKSLKHNLELNNFESHQLKYLAGQPRYEYLFKKSQTINEEAGKILAFFTWRDDQDNRVIHEMINSVQSLDNESLIILHDLMEIDISEYTNVCFAKDVDVQAELCKCEYFITDYSSVVWDAAALNKKTYLLWFDYEKYSSGREFYINPETVANIKAESVEQLKLLMANDFPKHNYFNDNADFDFSAIINGEHTQELVKHYLEKLEKKVEIYGYNFYGIGGTVTATKALVNGLLKQGYLVELISITKTSQDQLIIPGAVNKALVSFSERELYFLANHLNESSPRFQLDYTQNPNVFNEVTEARLLGALKNSTAKTIISTREIIHLYAADMQMDKKIYFMFHTDLDFFKHENRELYEEFKGKHFKNAIFLTRSGREDYINELDLTIDNSFIVPNALMELPRKRYGKIIEFNAEMKNIEFNQKYFNFSLNIATNSDYIIAEYLADLEFIIDGQRVNITKDETADQFPEYVTYRVENKIEIASLMTSGKNLQLMLQYKNAKSKLNLADLTYEFPVGFIARLIVKANNVSLESDQMSIITDEINEQKTIAFDNQYVELVNCSLKTFNAEQKTYIKGTLDEIYLQEVTIFDSFNDINAIMTLGEIYGTDVNVKNVALVLRLSKDRQEYIEEMINYGNYLAKNNYRIVLNVYGTGDYFNETRRLITENGLEHTIILYGNSTDVIKDTSWLDTQISFSRKESFGMTYIEAIMSGKRLFTYPNAGANEIFSEHPEIICHNFEQMTNCILNNESADFECLKIEFDLKYRDINVAQKFIGIGEEK